MDILDIAKKTMLTGIGLALVAKDEMEEVAKDLEKKLDMTEQDGKKFLSDLQKKYDEAQNHLEDRVEKAVKEFMKKADVVFTPVRYSITHTHAVKNAAAEGARLIVMTDFTEEMMIRGGLEANFEELKPVEIED